jgi:hypothetical protein
MVSIAGDMRPDDYQSYKLVNDPKPDVDQPTLIRKTRSGTCNSECSSNRDCAGSNTCPMCCWYFPHGNICIPDLAKHSKHVKSCFIKVT